MEGNNIVLDWSFGLVFSLINLDLDLLYIIVYKQKDQVSIREDTHKKSVFLVVGPLWV